MDLNRIEQTRDVTMGFRITSSVLAILTILLMPSVSRAQTRASFRVLLGVTDSMSTRWEGTIAVSQAGNYTVEGWRFQGPDTIDGNLFYIPTNSARLRTVPSGEANIVANGFIITADAVSDRSEFVFTAAPGDFRFR